MLPDKSVLVIDDEAQIRRLLGRALKRAGYLVHEATDAQMAIGLVGQQHFDAVIIDLGLPDRDGLELVAQFAEHQSMAILIVSARDATQEKITALDLGADDFITKPFDTEELLARLRVALRRRMRSADAVTFLLFGDIKFDPVLRKIERGDDEIHLTPKEYALFSVLAENAGKVLTHNYLLTTIWGPAHTADIEYLRVTARALRLKLEQDPSRPTLIRNEPGIGYRLTRD